MKYNHFKQETYPYDIFGLVTIKQVGNKKI